MSNRLKKLSQYMLVLFAFSIVVFSLLPGCARHPSKEEVTQLEQTREASEAAARKVTVKKQEKAEAEAELAEKKAELEKAKAIKAETEANLSKEQ